MRVRRDFWDIEEVLQVSMVRTNATYQVPVNWLSMVVRYDVALAPGCRGLNAFELARRVLLPLNNAQLHYIAGGFLAISHIDFDIMQFIHRTASRCHLEILKDAAQQSKGTARAIYQDFPPNPRTRQARLKPPDELYSCPAHASPITGTLGCLDAALPLAQHEDMLHPSHFQARVHLTRLSN